MTQMMIPARQGDRKDVPDGTGVSMNDSTRHLAEHARLTSNYQSKLYSQHGAVQEREQRQRESNETISRAMTAFADAVKSGQVPPPSKGTL